MCHRAATAVVKPLLPRLSSLPPPLLPLTTVAVSVAALLFFYAAVCERGVGLAGGAEMEQRWRWSGAEVSTVTRGEYCDKERAEYCDKGRAEDVPDR